MTVSGHGEGEGKSKGKGKEEPLLLTTIEAEQNHFEDELHVRKQDGLTPLRTTIKRVRNCEREEVRELRGQESVKDLIAREVKAGNNHCEVCEAVEPSLTSTWNLFRI